VVLFVALEILVFQQSHFFYRIPSPYLVSHYNLFWMIHLMRWVLALYYGNYKHDIEELVMETLCCQCWNKMRTNTWITNYKVDFIDGTYKFIILSAYDIWRQFRHLKKIIYDIKSAGGHNNLKILIACLAIKSYHLLKYRITKN